MIFKNKQKALDYAVWISFKERKKYCVIHDSSDFKVLEYNSNLDKKALPLPTSYKDMSYKQIESIWHDAEPLWHWQWIIDMVFASDQRYLQFLVEYEVPIIKMIRMQLAYSGRNKYKVKVSKEEAFKLWLK